MRIVFIKCDLFVAPIKIILCFYRLYNPSGVTSSLRIADIFRLSLVCSSQAS